MDHQLLQGRTLGECVQNFQKHVPKTSQFPAAYEVLSWLQDDVLSTSERVNAIYLLLEFAKTPENVFLGSVAELVELSPYVWENLLVQEWLRSKDLSKLAPSQILNASAPPSELQTLRKPADLRPVVNAGTTATDTAFLGCFEAEFLRPLPELLEVKSVETCWVTPLTVPEVVWDDECSSQLTEQMRELLQQAFEQVLPHDQLQTLVTFVQSSSSFCYRLRLSDEDVRSLVTKNATLAFELTLVLHSSNKFQGILETLINMPLDLPVLEALNALHMKIELPAEAIHFFVSNSLQTCRNMPKDHYERKRMTRLLSVFLISIINNDFHTTSSFSSEVLSFCSEFPNEKEVQQLASLVSSRDSSKH